MSDTAPHFSAGETLSAAKLNLFSHREIYVPELQGGTTNPDLGTGATVTGTIALTGQLVNIWWDIVFGTSPSVGSGTYYITPPAAYPVISLPDVATGTIRMRDASTTAEEFAQIIWANATSRFYLQLTDGGGQVAHNNPWTWAEGDLFAGHVTYLTDFDT